MSGLESSMMKARTAEKRGDFAEAERLYEGILGKFPRNARARQGLDHLFKARALATMKADAPPQAMLDALAADYRLGKLAAVAAQCEHLLPDYPRSAFLHNLASAANLGLGKPDAAAEMLRGAVAKGLRHPALFNNLGMALAQLGRHAEAIDAYRETIALDPRHAIARNNLGNALREVGRLDMALEAYDGAIAIQPDYADAHSNRGLTLRELGRMEDAKDAFATVLALQPEHAAACNNLGNVLADLGDLIAAVGMYRKAVGIEPGYADAHFNLGNAYKRQGLVIEAREAYARARAAKPDSADTWTEQGKTLVLEGRLDEAIDCFDRALAIDPANAAAKMYRLFHQAHVCDWSQWDGFDPDDAALDGAISPFAALILDGDPVRQLRRSRAWAAKLPRPTALPAAPQAIASKIRIGYFSADFHDHATLYLMAGLLREHDRDRFKIHAFSFGPDCDGEMRRQLIAQTDSFTDIRDLPDAAVADLARARSLDVAVDLKGYTQDARPQIFAQRLAPVQIAYLGYPGSMGAGFIDYLVADPVVVPEAERGGYDEKLILLPGSYQANDRERRIADVATTRADFGLPESGFVFCCFNQTYKIAPPAFDLWMRLLAQTAGSVLWLLRSNRWAEANLRREAAARGIDPARLVFADPLPQAEHLARHRHADLFLDTFNVNAHTTASDALWAGLPIVTLAGRQFAARVGASLLTAVGLPELVATSEAQYEALCRDLAADSGKLAELRKRLAGNRLAAPLFDSLRYARALEAGFVAAVERHRAGLAPQDIAIG